MITEALIVGTIGTVAITLIDHENLLGNNPEKLFWWERIFPKPTQVIRTQAIRPITPISSQQKIAQAQQTMAECQRQIALGNTQMMQESKLAAQTGKYRMTSW